MSLKITSFLLLSFSILLIFSCGSNTTESDSSVETPAEPSKTADYSVLAKAFCDCAQPSIELNQQMSNLQEAGKREEFVALAEQVGEKFKATMNCAREKKSAYTTAVLNPEETFKALMANCPNLPERLADNLSKVVK